MTKPFTHSPLRSWSYLAPAGSLIWKVLASERAVFLDIRNPEARTAELLALGIDDGTELWSQSSDTWWYSIDAVTSEAIVLQEFKESRVPVSSSIAILEAESGRLIERIAGQIIEVSALGLRCGDDQGIQLHELPGKIPQHFFPAPERWDNSMLDACSAEELRIGEYIVRSFYTPDGSSFQQHLHVCSLDGILVYEDVPLLMTDYPQGNAFFSVKTSSDTFSLLYVRELRELVAVEL